MYRRVLAREPGRKAALIELGRLLLRDRRFEEAIEVWRRATAAEPQRSGSAFQLARALHRSGRFDDAVAQYLRVLVIDPTHAKALSALEELSDRLARSAAGAAGADAAALADELLAQRSGLADGGMLAQFASVKWRSDPDAGFEYWSRLAALDAGAIEPPLQMARIRARQDRGDEARHYFRAVLERDPDHAEALAGYGRAVAEIDRSEAIRHFTTWAARRPRDAAPRLELARLHRKAEDWERAETVYRELLEHVPNDERAWTRLAQLLSRDRVEEALELWSRLAEREPAATFALVQRAYLFERTGRKTDAEAEYRAALVRAPDDAMALVGVARLLFGQARWSEAGAFYEALHRVNPNRGDALLGLGRCLERLDRTGDALTAYGKVLALDPANANALLYRGRLLRQLGRVEEAIAVWRSVCERAPQNHEAWHELVFMLATAERDDEALVALDMAEAALPASAHAWSRLGLAAQAGQFHDRATAYFERAITAEPHEASHHARLGQHYFRQGVADGAFHHLLAARELKPADLPVAKQLVDAVHTLQIVGVDHLSLSKGQSGCGEVLLPERLFRRVREIADTAIEAYEPVPRRVIAVTASLAAGGAERQLVNLLRGLSNPAFALDLALFCLSLTRRTRRDFFLPLLTETPIEIVVADAAAETCLDDPATAPYARLIRAFPEDMAGPIAFWLREFRWRRPQVVHAWQDGTNLTAVVAALLAGVPRIVLSTRSLRPDNPRRRLKRFMREGYQAVLAHPAVVLSNNSRAGADDYADWLGIDPGTVEVVYNGIDFESLAQGADPSRARQVRNNLGIPVDAPVVGSAFRMSEEKRPLLWVETAAEIVRREPLAHFIVCGDGPMRAEMIELVGRLGIAKRLHLPGPQDDIAPWYAAMDVVMLTSRHEGLPNVLLEAQSLGVPVVAPDVGGVGETVRAGVTGWTVRDADAGALAERVLFCLADPVWRAAARAAAPGFVCDRFGTDALLSRTLELYRL
jgi:glycosyltransferase involved in cell wall biosynthesis/Flp pilus assembly protein TadD